jgi:hypothetical protein
LTRDDPDSWKGHVGFFLRIEEDFVILLGGNQLEEVREHRYPVTSVLSYRWPSVNVKLPQELEAESHGPALKSRTSEINS